MRRERAEKKSAAKGKQGLSANPGAGTKGRLRERDNGEERSRVDVMHCPDVEGTWEDVEVPDIRGSGPRGTYAAGSDRAGRHFFEGFGDGGLVF